MTILIDDQQIPESVQLAIDNSLSVSNSSRLNLRAPPYYLLTELPTPVLCFL